MSKNLDDDVIERMRLAAHNAGPQDVDCGVDTTMMRAALHELAKTHDIVDRAAQAKIAAGLERIAAEWQFKP